MISNFFLHRFMSIFLCSIFLLATLFGCSASQNREPNSINTPTENSTFSVQFLDVGQGDCALVECDGQYMLIDGGNEDASVRILHVLKEQGIDHLDIVVATHLHDDHISGLTAVLKEIDADLVLCNSKKADSEVFKSFRKQAIWHGNGIEVPRAFDKYTLGSAEIIVLSVNAGSTAHDASLMLKIIYGETAFLFAGDASESTERALLENKIDFVANDVDLSANVLKVSRHGSKDASCYTFLRTVMPDHAVISVGADNIGGYPDEDTLKRLYDADALVYRTDLHGDISCVSDGKVVSFTTAIDVPPITRDRMEEERAKAELEGQYIANKRSGKFHTATCSIFPKEVNSVYFASREEAISEGFSACRLCNP